MGAPGGHPDSAVQSSSSAADSSGGGLCCACDGCGCWQAFGGLLYLAPRNAGIEYAVPVNSAIPAPPAPPVQEGHTAAVDPDFKPGFFIGAGTMLDACSSVSVTWTHYENGSNDSILPTGATVLWSMVMNPSATDARSAWTSASAHESLDFDFADIDYRYIFLANDSGSADILVGGRYANLKQKFNSKFDSLIEDTVDSNVNFEGAGLRVGLEAERNVGQRLFFVYGKTSASFLGGEFHADYLNTSTGLGGPIVAQTTLSEARLVSIVDLELGVGWASPGGRLRASLGYVVSSWMNVAKPADVIAGVQANQYRELDKLNESGLIFDGLVARTEFRW
ncbi:MAG: Lpg1974 family pore-forming outer membrane protein [Thermoguttaceae bacterium]|jgi:hypothetical protein